MKQKTQKKFFKIILLLFLVASITSASFVSCFADTVSVTVVPYSGSLGLWTFGPLSSRGDGTFFNVNIFSSVVYSCYASRSGSDYYFYAEINGVSTDGHTSSDNPAIVPEASSYTVVFRGFSSSSHPTYFRIEPASTPTPEPTRTPEPTPTPEPIATTSPIPDDFDDITFWEDMGTKATGIWSLITQFFNGIFSNTILRNIVVYIPLFSLILAFVIVLIKLGG